MRQTGVKVKMRVDGKKWQAPNIKKQQYFVSREWRSNLNNFSEHGRAHNTKHKGQFTEAGNTTLTFNFIYVVMYVG